MAVAGVLVDAQIGHQHHVVADLAAQLARARPARCPRDRRRPTRRSSLSAGTPNSITALTPIRRQLDDALAEALARVLVDARQRADLDRRVDALRGRTAGRSGRTYRRWSRRPGHAAPPCGAAGAGAGPGSAVRSYQHVTCDPLAQGTGRLTPHARFATTGSQWVAGSGAERQVASRARGGAGVVRTGRAMRPSRRIGLAVRWRSRTSATAPRPTRSSPPACRRHGPR